MSGYLQRLVRRSLGRAGAATLRPRSETTAQPPAEMVEGTEEIPAGQSSQLQHEAATAAPAAAHGASAGRPSRLPATSERPPSTSPAGTAALISRSSPTPSPRPSALSPQPPLPLPPASVRASRAADRESHAADRTPPAAIDPPRVHATVGATTSDEKAIPALTTPLALTRTAVERLAATAVARRLDAAAPDLAPPWTIAGRLFDAVRSGVDAEPRIEVHIGRVEVRSTPPPLPAPPVSRPRHRGFADLSATRRHCHRRWY